MRCVLSVAAVSVSSVLCKPSTEWTGPGSLIIGLQLDHIWAFTWFVGLTVGWRWPISPPFWRGGFAVLLFLFFLIKTLFATYVCIEIIYTGIGMGADMHHSRRQNMQPSSEESLFRVRLNGPSAQHARIIVCFINLPPHDV